jgi:ubiquinone/menaquinone biosynthesis C-methylase UbiE
MNEADIQVLASLRRAELESESSDRATLESRADRFWIFVEDWADSYSRLISEGLIEGDDNGYRLTEAGRPLGKKYHEEKPDHYWYYYHILYPAAQASKSHTRLCERVFGKDLCQDGQADMESIDSLLSHLELTEGGTLLDLGCGAGGISEYASDTTGARVTGLDFAPTAIETANARTQDKRDRLHFVQGDMNALDLPEQSFDAVMSVDTIYWAEDIDNALSSIARLVKPGGRLGIFIAHTPDYGEGPDSMEPDGSWIAVSLSRLGLEYDVYDFTESFLGFWPRMKKVAVELYDDFVAEGNEFIYAALLKDADDDYLLRGEAGELRRYLYIARVS